MKTIEQASQEYAKSLNLKGHDSFDFETYAKQDFKAGVEFAQRWISVEEEMPEKQGHYLVLAPKSFPKNCRVVVAEFYEDNKMFYSESSDYAIHDVTHWRPIELE